MITLKSQINEQVLENSVNPDFLTERKIEKSAFKFWTNTIFFIRQFGSKKISQYTNLKSMNKNIAENLDLNQRPCRTKILK